MSNHNFASILPILLQYHDVVLKVHLRNFNECYRNNSISTELTGYQISEFKVWADYVFLDMEERKKDTTTDVKELHSRITTVDRNRSDKIELLERRLMDEIKNLRRDITEHNKKEDTTLQKILEWKWMAAGGIITVAWILSNVKIEFISKLFG